MAGFYTEFELGLELDSVEVRGILLYHGQEWGRYVTLVFVDLFRVLRLRSMW
jgi:hypothetical protein